MRVKNSNHSALNREPELTPRTARASRLIADGMCPLRNTHNLRVPPLGWVSPAASASAPLGLSAHPYEPAHRPARALSWLTCHSARHRRAPRLQPGAATSQHSTGRASLIASLITCCPSGALFAHHRRRQVGVRRRHAAPFPAHHTSWRSDPLAVLWLPVLIWPARLLPTRPGGGGVADYMHGGLVLYWAGYIGHSWPVLYGASVPGAHAHDPRPGPSGLGFSGARREKRVHDGPRSLEQRPPRTRRLVRLKRRFNTAQQLVRDELDRRRDLVAHGTVDGAREELVERVLADIRLARLQG